MCSYGEEGILNAILLFLCLCIKTSTASSTVLAADQVYLCMRFLKSVLRMAARSGSPWPRNF